MKSFSKGFISVFTSLGKFRTYGVQKYLLLSGLTSLTIGIGIFLLGYSLSDDIGGQLMDWYPFDWGLNVLATLSEFIGGFLIVAVGLLLFKYLLLIINSPILSFVSEKVESNLTNHQEIKGLSLLGIISDMMRGLVISIKNFSKEIFYLIIISITSLVIPPLAPFLLILSFLIQAYFAGFGNLDYFMERRFNASQSNAIAQSNKLGLIGIGSGFLVVLMLPVLGWIFAPIMATIAATEYGVFERLDPEIKEFDLV